MPLKPNCFDCKHMRTIPGDAHIECAHPSINEVDRMLTPMLLMSGLQNAPCMKRLNVMGDSRGILHGWFMWPLNFDPTWLQTCDGFEKKGGEAHETKQDK